MRLLLDTHAFLWLSLDDSKLPDRTRDALMDDANRLFLSPASYWELAVKITVGKYRLTRPFEDFVGGTIAGYGMTVLPILPSHAEAVTRLPLHHRDPFDRLLIAQALVERLTVVTADRAFAAYGVPVLW